MRAWCVCGGWAWRGACVVEVVAVMAVMAVEVEVCVVEAWWGCGGGVRVLGLWCAWGWGAEVGSW